VRLLQVASVVEALSLALLLLNLATAHQPAVAAAVGPLHGAAYLVVVVAALQVPGAPRAARWWAVLPGIGGLLAVRRLRTASG
jgi:hypothetical protein